MIAGYSIRKSAKIVEINIATSFFWRHKILDCIRSFFGIGSVEGVIEADEVFLLKVLKEQDLLKCQGNLVREVKKLKREESLTNKYVLLLPLIDRVI